MQSPNSSHLVDVLGIIMIVDDNICLIIASAYSNVSWNKTTLEATHVLIDTFNFFQGIPASP
jgi:hypothetical protein